MDHKPWVFGISYQMTLLSFMIDLSFRYHRCKKDQNDPPAPIAASKGKKAEQILVTIWSTGRGHSGFAISLTYLGL